MFLIRESRPDDVPTLVKLARMVFFINLPPDERIIAGKVEHSQRCFKRVAGGAPAKPVKRSRRGSSGGGWASIEDESDLFMFSIEDVSTRSVIGTSQVRAHQGGPGNPNWSLKISQKKFHSPQLGFGTTHTVGQLYGDETGPTEIGGLIIQPSFRGNAARPGRLLSFVRFHFMGLYRALFADRVIAEMAPPVTSSGDNAFWDHFGRKFIPVKYSEADGFCQHNRRFISELFPKDEIYLTLFPLEILNMVGVVSRETVPARRLLESLGFSYKGFVDPFDGAPHLDAPTDAIPLVRETRRCTIGRAAPAERCDARAIVSTLSNEGEFKALEAPCMLDGEDVRLTQEGLDALGVAAGQVVGVTPMRESTPEPSHEHTSDATQKEPSGIEGAAGAKARGVGKASRSRRKART